MAKKKLIEPYAKDRNFLQLPLFYFGRKPIPTETITEWKDTENNEYKLICSSRYGVPTSFDMDVYTGCMRIWVLQGMDSRRIVVNYSEIARELDLNPKNWVTAIKKSLIKLGQARYHFQKCFIHVGPDETKQIDAQFSLFDTTLLFSKKEDNNLRKSESVLTFPEEIQQNLESKYYQMLDMKLYKSLPSGLARRLYEYLDKRKYHGVNGVFQIAEDSLCRWLPVNDNHTTNRRKTLKKISQALIDINYLANYEFKKARQICSFSYRVDHVSSEATGVPKAEQTKSFDRQIFLEIQEWLNSIPYLHKNRKREILALPGNELINRYDKVRGEYEKFVAKEKQPKPRWIYENFMVISPKEDQSIPKEEKQKNNNTALEDLINLIKLRKIPQKLRIVIEKYFRESGPEYVRWNILYANKNAKNNYAVYLQKSLAENWAEEWIEEEKNRLHLEEQQKKEHQKALTEKQIKVEKSKRIKEQKIKFLETIAKFDKNIKKELWLEAEREMPEGILRREMNVKLSYAKKLLEFLRNLEDDFHEDLLEKLDFPFINRIAED